MRLDRLARSRYLAGFTQGLWMGVFLGAWGGTPRTITTWAVITLLAFQLYAGWRLRRLRRDGQAELELARRIRKAEGRRE
jgi:hypothetical protein